MSTYPKEPRTEPDSVYEPDPTPDTETYPEVVQRVREALYQAAEQGAEHYEGKHSRLIDLLDVCRWTLASHDIREWCETGQYTGDTRLERSLGVTDGNACFGWCGRLTMKPMWVTM